MNVSGTDRRRAVSMLRSVIVVLLLAVADSASAHGPLVEQIAQVSREIEGDPSNAQLYLRRGELRRVHEEWDAALADYARGKTLAPDDDRIDFLRGRALQEAGRPWEAKAALDLYLARHPADVEALVARARALRALGEHRAAVDDYGLALGRMPRPDPDLYLQRAQTQLAAGDLAAAVEGIDSAIHRLGPIASLQLFAVELDVRQGRIDSALTRLDVVASRSARRETWHARRGEVLALAGRPAEARTAYTAALSAIDALPRESRRTKAIADLEGRVRSALASLSAITSASSGTAVVE